MERCEFNRIFNIFVSIAITLYEIHIVHTNSLDFQKCTNTTRSFISCSSIAKTADVSIGNRIKLVPLSIIRYRACAISSSRANESKKHVAIHKQFFSGNEFRWTMTAWGVLPCSLDEFPSETGSSKQKDHGLCHLEQSV